MEQNQTGHSNPMDSFKLIAETQRQVAQVTHRATDILKQTYKNPADLAACIEQHGTPVYTISGSVFLKMAFFFLGFEPGFIPPSRGRRYRMLQKICRLFKPKPACSLEQGVFILTPSLYTVGYLAHQLHHWISFKAGMAGYQEQDQKQYRRFWEKNRGVLGPEVEKMTASEIISLKNAITRDLEALKFIQQITYELFVPAQQAGRLSNGNASA